ncbi:hypothetical protein V1512DRAFT_263194 [Lipomyces arxii]|uniref:uncharacterized protein n=1 Tax=Lipomyces arxii TaxID=56418 RepID=UPI0034CD5437
MAYNIHNINKEDDRYSSASPVPPILERQRSNSKHFLSPIQPSQNPSPGYSSAEVEELSDDTPEDPVNPQYVPSYRPSTLISPLSSSSTHGTHGIEHRPSIVERHDPFEAEPRSAPAHAMVQDTKWKLYDPQPFLSHLVHHDTHRPAEPEAEPVSPESERRPSARDSHHHHKHHHEKRFNTVQLQQPPYNRSHYTFSAGASNTRELLSRRNTSTSSVSSIAPDEMPAHEPESMLEAGDEEDTESSSDESPKPTLIRRSSTNYQTELSHRRQQQEASKPTGPPTVIAKLETKLARLTTGSHIPSKTSDYQSFEPSHYSIGSRTHSFYRPASTNSKNGSVSDDEGPAYENHPSLISATQQGPLHDLHESPKIQIPAKIEEDLLRRLSADSDTVALDTAVEHFQEPQSPISAKSAHEAYSPTFLYQSRTSSFSYDDYKKHYHGMLMTPEEEKKPGFSCTE